MSGQLWSVVLAAGAGRRLASVTGGIPKQFWAPRGGRTLLEHTIDRVRQLVPPAHIVTVVDASQREYATTVAARTPLGRVAMQASDRGTAVGVLRGLVEMRSADDDLVVVTPSDHGVARSRIYHLGLQEAAWAVQSGGAAIVLMAAEPASAASDLGWILPSAASVSVPGRIGHVRRFVEKPPPAAAAQLFTSGGLWNTMVMVARVTSLLELYRERAPMLADLYDRARTLAATRRAVFLSARYRQLASTDLSHDILAGSKGLHVYRWPRAIGWTDLGTPSRLHDWLETHRAPAERPPAGDAIAANL